jgi:hypothetical protein
MKLASKLYIVSITAIIFILAGLAAALIGVMSNVSNMGNIMAFARISALIGVMLAIWAMLWLSLIMAFKQQRINEED